MKKAPWAVLAAASAAAFCCVGSPALGVTPPDGLAAVDRVLGADNEARQKQLYLPFTRRLNASGVVAGSLADSTEAAGVPRSAMLEALRALATALDLKRDLKDGDRFWVRYEQEYTVEGNPVGIGRVLWVELRSKKKGTVAIHRFAPGRGQREAFWLATGLATESSDIRLPLDAISVSSGFGMRVDPFDQSRSAGAARGATGPLRTQAPPPSPLKANPAGGPDNVNVATPLGISMGLSPGGAAASALPRRGGAMVMHQGVDFVADPGTPVHAAAGGTVVGAHWKGPYGNWIEIAHGGGTGGVPGGGQGGGLSTVYGHLSAYAPDMYPGAVVGPGQVIGYVGSTGRSTGFHLHFELLVNGRPVDPMKHGATARAQLRGADLERFRKLAAANLEEAEREGKPR